MMAHGILKAEARLDRSKWRHWQLELKLQAASAGDPAADENHHYASHQNPLERHALLTRRHELV